MSRFNIVLICAFCILQQTTFAQSANDIESLSKEMRSGEVAARAKAIERLGQTASVPQDVMEGLRDLYLNDSSEQIRRAARIALGKLQRKAKKTGAVASAKPIALSPTTKTGSGEKITAGLAAPGTFGFGINYFSPEDYVDPEPPTERVAKLMKQLKEDPKSSIEASAQLAKLGQEALPASQTLIEIMMRGADPSWHDARIAATECLEKIFPELQKPVWKSILEEQPNLPDIANLGPRGYPALPMLFVFWNAPEEKGYRINADILATMHVVALKDPSVTEQVVRVLKGDVSVGGNCFRYAIEICDQRGLPPEQIVQLLTPSVLIGRTDINVTVDAEKKLMQMVADKRLDPEPVVKLFIRHIESIEQVSHATETITYLGHLGPAAKEALPLLKKLKYEAQDGGVREVAGEAMNLIDR